MNWDQIAGEWKQFSGKIRQKWGKLTDDEIQQAKGSRDRLAGIIQERYGVSKDEVHRQLDELLASHEKTRTTGGL